MSETNDAVVHGFGVICVVVRGCAMWKISCTSAGLSVLWVQHLQSRCLEDRFLPQQKRKTSITKARPLQSTFPNSGSPQNGQMTCPATVGLPRKPSLVTLDKRASLDKRHSSKDDSSALSLPATRLQGNFPHSCLKQMRLCRPCCRARTCHVP